MKSFWSFFLLTSLFRKSYCSIEGNVGSQPPTLLKSAFILLLAKWQMDHSLTKEPFVAYNKLKDGTLEMVGSAFDNEMTEKKISFLQEILSNFNIHSVALKWFYFDEKISKIFNVFDKKMQNSVKSVTVELCYFPETFVFKSCLELNSVTKCSFIQCFTNEESFKQIFKIFKNATVTALTISKVFDCNQPELIDTNIALKTITSRNVEKRSVKINDLKLDSFFPKIKFLSLSSSSLDFVHFNLTSLMNLNDVVLNDVVFENLRAVEIFQRLPLNVKRIKIFNAEYYDELSFVENASVKKIIADTISPFKYDKIDRVTALSVFSSLDFDMRKMNDKMAAIKEYVESNGVVVTVTSIQFCMVFNYESIKNMITLLTYFPNLDNLEVWFNGDCDTSLNDSEVHQLFSALPIRNVKKLFINFRQNEETAAFYCFIGELMKLCQKMSSLKFHYYKSNSFAINIKKIVERENIQFTNLDTFTVHYWSRSEDILIDFSVDLFYLAKYNIKNLTVEMGGLIQNLNGLDQFGYFPVDNLSFYVHNNTYENLINKLFAKFPHVTNFIWKSASNYLISTSAMQNMKRLKNVSVHGILCMEDFVTFLTLLPLDLESLEIRCFSNEIEEFERVFYEKFPGTTFTVTV